MSVLNENQLLGSSGAGGAYDLTDSVRFRSSASAYLSRTPTSTGDRQKFTVSFWFKRGDLGVSSRILFQQRADVNNSQQFNIGFRSDDAIAIIDGDGGVTVGNTATNALYRDTASWYHIVVARDSTNATADDRTKLYINGDRVTSFLASTNVALNYSSSTNTTDRILIGCQRPNSSSTLGNFYDGYLTEFNLVDGQALTPSDFGETDTTTGVWKPIEYTGTYGTNGFYLPMKATTQAEGFNAVAYTGIGTSGTKITNVGFQPDLVWVKNRDQADWHHLFDSVRGVSGGRLSSNDTATEHYEAEQLQSFDVDGYTYGTSHSGNASGEDYVAWCWKAGSSTVSNTDGDITASVRANPATGFSILTYTGNGASDQSIGHGLSTAPKVLICKERNNARLWDFTYTCGDGSYDFMKLNETDAKVDIIGRSAPTDSLIYVSGVNSNTNTSTYVAYCFSEVAGYSKFGSYTGNGTSQSINLGFRPAFVMWKRTNGTNSWIIKDNTRYADNQGNLFPNAATAENTDTSVTFTDTGFDVDSSLGYNGSGREFIYMAFADTRDFQWNFDASGNKNNWTPNNINSNASSDTTYDIMNDVATLTDEDTGNYAMLNPLDHFSTNVDFSEANLKYTVPAGSYTNGTVATSTITMTSGKWYCEMTALSDYSMMGVAKLPRANMRYLGDDVTGYGYYTNGSKYNNASAVSYGATFTTNDVIGVALDLDAGTLTFYKNGVSQGTAFTGLSGEFVFATGNTNVSNNSITAVNFGQRPFAYTPPTGYKKLNTYNLPDSAIKDGSQYMNPVTYTGDGIYGKSITGLGFSPDLVWIKRRDASSNQFLHDTIRNARLSSNLTTAEGVSLLTSFDSDGFTLGANAGVNGSGATYVAWNWRGSDSSAVSNTDGTITSTVSANPTAGFSVVTYTGTGANATVGHGLGDAPKVIVIKNRTSANSWPVYHSSLGNTQLIVLDLTNAAATSSVYWNNTSPTTSVFTIGTAGSVNTNTSNYVAYCFAEVEGYSKFGSYTGNGSADGPFVYTGFRPAFVLCKRTDGVVSWVMFDTGRDTYNVGQANLYPNLSNAEGTGPSIDFLSNGFKLRTASGDANPSGNVIYMAFAENPFKNSLAR